MAYQSTAAGFRLWCNKVIPLVYDESLSYYEVLCKLMEWTQRLASNEDELFALTSTLQTSIEQLQTDWPLFQADIQKTLNAYKATLDGEVADIQQTLQDIQDGKYVDTYLGAIQTYIDQNLQNFVSDIVKYVQFGLNDDGYFCAYIPENWGFLNFTTVTDPDSDLYGHLVMYY